MKQIITGNSADEVSGSISPIQDCPIGAQRSLGIGGMDQGFPVAAAGQLSRFHFWITDERDATDEDKIIRFRNDTTATSVELTLPVGQSSISDDVSTIPFSAGDLFRIQVTNGGSGNPSMYVGWSCLFTGTNSNEAFSGGNSSGSFSSTETYIAPMGLMSTDTTEANVAMVIPTDITLKSFYFQFETAGGGTSTRTVSIFKNGAEVAATVLNYNSAETTKNVTGLSVAFSAGGTMSIKYTSTNNPLASLAVWGFMYNPTIDGESIIAGIHTDSLATTQGTQEFFPLHGYTDNVPATRENHSVAEEGIQQRFHDTCVLKKFRVKIASAPGASQTRRFRVRSNFADTSAVVSISGSNTTGADNTNTVPILNGDILDVSHEVVSSGAGACTLFWWSSVLYIDPGGGATTAPVSKYNVGTNGKVIVCPVEGTGNTATMDFQNITDNRTYTFPNKGGTISTQAAALTATRVPFADANGQLTDDADMTFVTDTLTVAKIAAALNGTVGATTPNSGVFTSLQADSITNDTGLAAGVYTPTRSAESNLDANVTMTEAQYLRVGNTVTVSGRFTADPTAAGAASFEITLPVSSNIGAAEDVAGVAFSGGIAGQGAEIIGVVANDTAKIQWIAVDTTSQTWSYTFTYQVI